MWRAIGVEVPLWMLKTVARREASVSALLPSLASGRMRRAGVGKGPCRWSRGITENAFRIFETIYLCLHADGGERVRNDLFFCPRLRLLVEAEVNFHKT